MNISRLCALLRQKVGLLVFSGLLIFASPLPAQSLPGSTPPSTTPALVTEASDDTGRLIAAVTKEGEEVRIRDQAAADLAKVKEEFNKSVAAEELALKGVTQELKDVSASQSAFTQASAEAQKGAMEKLAADVKTSQEKNDALLAAREQKAKDQAAVDAVTSIGVPQML